MSLPPRVVDNEKPALVVDIRHAETNPQGYLRIPLSDSDLAWIIQSASAVAAARLWRGRE